jgi:hypothetical protein
LEEGMFYTPFSSHWMHWDPEVLACRGKISVSMGTFTLLLAHYKDLHHLGATQSNKIKLGNETIEF